MIKNVAIYKDVTASQSFFGITRWVSVYTIYGIQA